MRNLLAATLLASVAASAVMAQDATTPTPATEAKSYDAETVLATVDGNPITLGHVVALSNRLPPQYQNLPDDVLLNGLLDQLIDQQLLADAQAAGPDGDPASIRLHLENERRGALAGIAAEAAVRDAVDDAKVQAAYDRQVEEFQPQPEYHAAHILVDSEDKAKALKAEIDGGADFAELAAANSSDGSAASGGDLGWFGPGQMVPEFEAAVVAMEPGAVAGPVQTQFGWHLIKLDETRQSAAPALAAARPVIEDQLRQDALQAKIAELKATAKIDRPDTGTPPAAVRDNTLLTN